MKYLLKYSLLFLLFSCSSAKFISKSVKPFEVKEMDYFDPLISVKLINEENKVIINDSIIQKVKTKFNSVIGKFEYSKISDEIEFVNLEEKANFNNLIAKFLESVRTSKDIDDVTIEPELESYLNLSKNRFVLVTSMNGFGRVKKNYNNELAKGVGIGLLTLGLYIPVPVKGNVNIQSLIFDKQRKRAVFVGNTMPNEDSPFNINHLEKQFINSFIGFYLSY